MLGCEDKIRSHKEVRDMFNDKDPNRLPISQSAVSMIAKKWRTFNSVRVTLKVTVCCLRRKIKYIMTPRRSS